MPAAVAHIWAWFGELERVRDVSQVGLRPITYSEIDAWARRTGRAPTPEEVDALIMLDVVTRFPGDG